MRDMRISETTRVLNLVIGAFKAIEGAKLRCKAELPVHAPSGNTSLDFIAHVDRTGKPGFYTIVESKICRSSLDPAREADPDERAEIREKRDRFAMQYKIITGITPDCWDSKEFIQEAGHSVDHVLLFINSGQDFIMEYLATISAKHETAAIDFLMEKQTRKTKLLQGTAIVISECDFLAHLEQAPFRLLVPFTKDDLLQSKVKRKARDRMTLESSSILVPLFTSFLLEQISTRQRSFTADMFFDALFEDVLDFFTFGLEERKAIKNVLGRFLDFVAKRCVFKKSSKIIERSGTSYDIKPRNSKNLQQNIKEIQASIKERIAELQITLDDFLKTKDKVPRTDTRKD